MSAELIGILAVGVTLLVGLGGMLLMLGTWLRSDIRALGSRVATLDNRVARIEGVLASSRLFGPAKVPGD